MGDESEVIMTVYLSCGDVIPGCAAVFEAENEGELLGQVATHAEADHGIAEIDDETLAAVKSVIRTS